MAHIDTSIPSIADDRDWFAADDVNLSPFERGASITLGAALIAWALSRQKGLPDLWVAFVGGYLAYRGARGRCAVYDLLDAGAGLVEEDERLAVGGHDDRSTEAVLTIARPVDEVYAFWRRLENAPRFMTGIVSVEVRDERRSRWTAQGPEGEPVSWESEVLEDSPGELIAWRSLPGSKVRDQGAVRFLPAPGNRGTEVWLDVQREVRTGGLGRAVARLLRRGEEYPAEEDLRRLRQLLEAGEAASTAGQPWGETGPPPAAVP
jgi:uncharacterized membrane protein